VDAVRLAAGGRLHRRHGGVLGHRGVDADRGSDPHRVALAAPDRPPGCKRLANRLVVVGQVLGNQAGMSTTATGSVSSA
jgi:hypothetical protein